jgi:hypothetical protein
MAGTHHISGTERLDNKSRMAFLGVHKHVSAALEG